MIFRYGSYSHQSDNVSIVVGTANERSQQGTIQTRVTTLSITGRVDASSVSELTTAIQHLQRAYQVDGQDCGLYTDANVPTAHVWSAGECDSIRVMGDVQFPDGTGGEYTTYRHFAVTIEIRQPPVGTSSDIVEWVERFETIGNGGPQWVMRPTVNGPPVKDVIFPSTPRKMVQSGSAVGRTFRPTPPSPIYPDALHGDTVGGSYETPRMRNPDRFFPIIWKYEMEM